MTALDREFASHVPSWRIPKLRDTLQDAQERGRRGEHGTAASETHRALVRRFVMGQQQAGQVGCKGKRNKLPQAQRKAVWSMVLQVRPAGAKFGSRPSAETMAAMLELHQAESEAMGWRPASKATLYSYYCWNDPPQSVLNALELHGIYEPLERPWEKAEEHTVPQPPKNQRYIPYGREDMVEASYSHASSGVRIYLGHEFVVVSPRTAKRLAHELLKAAAGSPQVSVKG